MQEKPRPEEARSPSRFSAAGIVVLLLFSGYIAILFLVDSLVSRPGDGGRTKSTANQLAHSIATYYTEYRRYPIPERATGPHPWDTYLLSNGLLMGELLGDPSPVNPRGIVFFSANKARINGRKEPFSGVHFGSSGSPSLYDRWGNFYRVIMDTDRDGSVELPNEPTRWIRRGAIVWSLGPDGVDGTNDDIGTWP